MRRLHTNERRLVGATSALLPAGPAVASASTWNPSKASETFAWFDATQMFSGAAENDAAATWTNLTDSRSLIASLTGTNCKVRNIRGRKAVWLNRSAPSKMAALISTTQAQPVVIFIVATSDTPNSTNVLMGGGPGGALAESRISLTGTVWPRTMTGGAGVTLSAGANNQTQNHPFVSAFKYNGGTLSKIYLGETLKNTGNGGTANFEGFTIGDARAGFLPFGGLVSEIVGMLAPSDALILQTQQYLEAKYVTAAKSWRVMRVGDSITAGTGGTTDANGIGQALAIWSNGAPGGAYLDFVGAQSNMTLYSNAQHYGVGGADTYTLGPLLNAQLTAFSPDIIDLQIGVNDANATGTPYVGATSQSNFAAILANCRTALPNSYVLAGSIPQSQAGTNVADLNSRWATAIATEKGLGGKIIDRDDFTALNGGVWANPPYADGLHPDPTGYAYLATEHERALLAAIVALG